MNRVWALPFLLLSVYMLSSCNNSDEAKAKRAERKAERQERKEQKKQGQLKSASGNQFWKL